MDFEDKTLLISGGTGSFGNAVLHKFLETKIKEIRIYSRDEKKQDDMRKRYNNNKLKFYLGDVRDYRSVEQVMRGVDYVFHAAALKQVPSCEFYPMQAVYTNIYGTENILESAIKNQVKRVVCLSTDKAVYPINAMGMSKALMEKVVVASSRNLNKTESIICGTRYGNVMGSRGSVIPLFVNQIKEDKPITVTNPEMTRFMMSLSDAVNLVLFAFEKGNNGDLLIQKSPAATVLTLAQSIREIMNKENHPIKIIGTRHGEKLYETLMSKEELACAEDLGRYYRIPIDKRDLNYHNYVENGDFKITESTKDYNSHNTQRLNVKEMKEILLKINLFS